MLFTLPSTTSEQFCKNTPFRALPELATRRIDHRVDSRTTKVEEEEITEEIEIRITTQEEDAVEEEDRDRVDRIRALEQDPRPLREVRLSKFSFRTNWSVSRCTPYAT